MSLIRLSAEPADRLRIVLWHSTRFGKDPEVGTTEISVAELLSKSEQGEGEPYVGLLIRTLPYCNRSGSGASIVVWQAERRALPASFSH